MLFPLPALDPIAVLFCGSQEVKCASTSASPSLPSLVFFPLDAVQVVSDLAQVFGSFIWTSVLVCVVVRLNCFSL